VPQKAEASINAPGAPLRSATSHPTSSEAVDRARQPAGWTTVTWDGTGVGGRLARDGRYRFEIRSYYPSGHESIPVEGQLTIDSVPPEIGHVRPINGSTVRTGMPTITARLASDPADVDDDKLLLKIDEITVAADRYDPRTGEFSFTPKTSLGEGVHIAIAYAQDWAGNYAPPQAVSFRLDLGGVASTGAGSPAPDRTKPKILKLQPDNVDVFAATPVISARVRDGQSGIDPQNIELRIDGVRVSNSVRYYLPGTSGEPWDWYSYEKSIVLYDPLQGELRYVPLKPLKEGLHEVALQVMDKAGNKSALRRAVFNVVVDNDPPTIQGLRPARAATIARPPDFVSAKVVDAGSRLAEKTLRLTVDGREVTVDPAAIRPDPETGEVSIPLGRRLSRDAQHAVQLTVRDRAGNLSVPATSVFSIVRDDRPPRIDVIAPAGNSNAATGNSGTVLYVAAVYDLGRSGLDPSSLVLKLDGVPIGRFDPANGRTAGYLFENGLLTHRFSNLPPGQHVVSLSVTDRAGNAAEESICELDVE